MNHWSSMGGVACSTVTKQLSGRNLTYDPSHPNLLVLIGRYPHDLRPKLGTCQMFGTTRMIPLDQVSQVVGMAGIDGSGK